MMDLSYCAERLPCGDGEKRALLETVRALAEAAALVRGKGLLALEDAAETWEDPLFRDCARLVTDDPESERLRELFDRLLVASDRRGAPFLRAVLIETALELIAAGESRYVLARELAAWLGPGWREPVEAAVREGYAATEERIRRKGE